MDKIELITDFEIYLKFELGLAEKTVESYAYDAKTYLKFLEETGNENAVPIISERLVKNYIGWLRKGRNGKPVSDGTLIRRFSGVYQFWDYLQQDEKDLVDDLVPRKRFRLRTKKGYLATKPIHSDEYKILLRKVFDELYKIH